MSPVSLGVLASAHHTAGGAPPAYLGWAYPTSAAGTTATFPSFPLGTAAANRNVVIAVTARFRVPASAVIGGVSATLHASFSDGVSNVAVFSAVVPTGTSGSVTVTHTTGYPEGVSIGAWAAYGTLAYSTHATSGTGSSVTLTAPANAMTVAAHCYIDSASDINLTLSGVSADYSEYHYSQVNVGGGMATPSAGSHSVTSSVSASYSNSALMAVDFTLT